jgi:hypothetical protein
MLMVSFCTVLRRFVSAVEEILARRLGSLQAMAVVHFTAKRCLLAGNVPQKGFLHQDQKIFCRYNPDFCNAAILQAIPNARIDVIPGQEGGRVSKYF